VLWKQLNPRYRKLLRSGQQGQAVVVKAEADNSRDEMGEHLFGYNLTMRVKYADGTTADFDRYLEATHLHFVSPGTTLPIRFDPGNRSRVEIDVEVLDEVRATQTEQAEAAQEAAVQQAQDRLQPLDTNPPDYPGT
jgi:hypothetical protein